MSKLFDQKMPVPCLRLSFNYPQYVSPLGYSMACTFLRNFPSEPQMQPVRKEQTILFFSYSRRVEQTDRCPDITTINSSIEQYKSHSKDPPLQMRQSIQQESSGLARRQSEQRRQPQFMAEQLVNLRQTTHPMMRRMDGAGSTVSLGSNLFPSPHIGALQSASIKVQSFPSQPGHSIVPIEIIPLQHVIFIFLLHPLHFSLKWAFMGEPLICMNLLGATSSIFSAGWPSETVNVVNSSCGGQFSSEFPSGVMTLMRSRVFLTKATLLISVQN